MTAPPNGWQVHQVEQHAAQLHATAFRSHAGAFRAGPCWQPLQPAPQAQSPLPVRVTLRHASAGFNCATARGAGPAQARQGEPGYWAHVDVDGDGIACEPRPAGRAP